jgi:hypothetical protein
MLFVLSRWLPEYNMKVAGTTAIQVIPPLNRIGTFFPYVHCQFVLDHIL